LGVEVLDVGVGLFVLAGPVLDLAKISGAGDVQDRLFGAGGFRLGLGQLGCLSG
jgi:hypothetical protein